MEVGNKSPGRLRSPSPSPSPGSKQSRSPLRKNSSGNQLELRQSQEKHPLQTLKPSLPKTTTEQTLALAKIQAFGRGTLARREMVLPYQLEGTLKNALTDLSHSSSQSEDLSKILAREILESAKIDYQNHGKRLSITSGTYQYAGKELKVPMDIWISRKGNKVEIELISSKPLIAGGLKEIYPSHTIMLSLEAPEHEREFQKTVVARFLEKDKTLILPGLELVSRNFSDQEIKELHLAGILTKIDRVSSTNTAFRENEVSGLHEARDIRYIGDLFDFVQKSTPTIEQKKKILFDVAKAVKAFHQKGIVHGDIKSDNILVDEAGNGYLADFDTVGPPRVSPSIGGTKEYRDRFSMLGIATPFTDIYALARLTLQLGIPSTAAQAVTKANEGTFKAAKENTLKKSLSSEIPEVRQKALEDLNKDFPEFQIFLDSLIEVD